MERGLDWYKRDPISFLDAVQGLGPELIGAYSVLLDLLYARAGETPRDDRHLAGILGCSTRKAKALTDALIEAGKITVQDGFIVNSRAKSEAKPRRDVRETKANAGRKGGEKSGEARRNKALAEAYASSKTEPDKSKRREESPLTPQGGQELEDPGFAKIRRGRGRPTYVPRPETPPQRERFDRFWAEYPNREEERQAYAKFRCFMDQDQEDLVEAARRYRRKLDQSGKGYTYAFKAKNWLNRDPSPARKDGGFSDYLTPIEETDAFKERQRRNECNSDAERREDRAADSSDLFSGGEEVRGGGGGDDPVECAEPGRPPGDDGLAGVPFGHRHGSEQTGLDAGLGAVGRGHQPYRRHGELPRPVAGGSDGGSVRQPTVH